MTRLLLGVLLLAVSWAATAADTALYKVELIIFENLDPAALHAEQWPGDPGTPPLDNARELNALTTAAPSGPAVVVPALADTTPVLTPPQPIPVIPSWRRLNRSEQSLNWAEQKISSSENYRLLLHIGWVQPLDSSGQGTPVHIYDGLKPQQSINANTITPQLNAPQALTTPLFDTDPQAAPEVNPAQALPHVLDGTLTLSRGRFLHLDADIGYRKTYTPEVTTPDSGAIQPVTLYVRMAQSRRLRSDELHYLDHPLFGVLFVVSPYQPATANTLTK